VGGATGKRGLIPGGDFVSETAIALQIVVILSYLRMLFEVEKKTVLGSSEENSEVQKFEI